MARLLGTIALAIALSTGLGAAQLASSDAGAFMGSWSLMLDSPQGAFELDLREIGHREELGLLDSAIF